jgi:hypothetical protein
MSTNVSVSYTPCQPIFRLLASCRETLIPNTLSYVDVGIGTNEVVTTYEDEKIWNVYRLIYSLSDFAASQEQGTYLE